MSLGFQVWGLWKDVCGERVQGGPWFEECSAQKMSQTWMGKSHRALRGLWLKPSTLNPNSEPLGCRTSHGFSENVASGEGLDTGALLRSPMKPQLLTVPGKETASYCTGAQNLSYRQ